MRLLALTAVLSTATGCPDFSPSGDDAAIDASAPDSAPVADAMPTVDARPACVEGDLQIEDPTTGSCYMYFDDQQSWPAARARCEAIGSSVHLVTIANETENTIVSDLSPGPEVWIGGNDLAVNGTFVWITGEPFVYTNFRAGEPNGGNGESCLILQPNQSGQWDDRSCGNGGRYVCERD